MGCLKGGTILFNEISQIRFYSFHIPIWDRMEREISDALLPVAFSAAWMLVAKKYVLPAVLI